MSTSLATTARRAAGPVHGSRLAAALTWQPALHQARAYLEAVGLAPDEAERLSRSLVVACASHAEPDSSEEATRLTLEEAKTLALGFVHHPPGTPLVQGVPAGPRQGTASAGARSSAGCCESSRRDG